MPTVHRQVRRKRRPLDRATIIAGARPLRPVVATLVSSFPLVLGAFSVVACFPDSVTEPDPAPTTNYTAVAVGAEHTCAIDTQSRALCWGANRSGQLGTGDFGQRLVPAFVSDNSFDGLEAIAAGGAHTCGIATDGWTYCWGFGLFGQIGDGALNLFLSGELPRRVSGDHRFVTIAAGDAHTCGLTEAGSAWCWGVSFDGRLGDGEGVLEIIVPEPDSVLSDESFVSITAGDRHTCALTAAGKAFCWGDNEWGQLGIGSALPLVVFPLPVSGGHSFTSLDAGSRHTCGVNTAGEVLCWGAGDSGQIGDGERADRLAPIPVQSDETFVGIAAGGDHTCATASDDDLWCWGRIQVGSIGDNTVEYRPLPALVEGSLTAFRGVRAGDRPDGATNCGFALDGVLHCWGWGRTGQIGNGSIYDQPEPTRVDGQP